MEQREAVERDEPDNRGRGRPKIADRSTKVNLTVPDVLIEKFEELRQHTAQSSFQDFVRQALVFYSAAINQHKDGGRVIFRDKDGNDRELAIFI